MPMYSQCQLDDNVARIAVNIVLKLEEIGVTRPYAKNVAVEWLAKRCNIPRIIAFEVHSCLMDHHSACPRGAIVPTGTNILMDKAGTMICEVHHSLCNKWQPKKP